MESEVVWSELSQCNLGGAFKNFEATTLMNRGFVRVVREWGVQEEVAPTTSKRVHLVFRSASCAR